MSCVFYLLEIAIVCSVSDVFGDGTGEKFGVLGNGADRPAKFYHVDFVIRNAVSQNDAFAGAVGAENKPGQCALSGPVRADDGKIRAWTDEEVQAIQHRPLIESKNNVL